MNSSYREVSWWKSQYHMSRIVNYLVLKKVTEEYGKTPIQTALAWGVNIGPSVISKSVLGWYIKDKLEAGFKIEEKDIGYLKTMDVKMRFNDPTADIEGRSVKHGWICDDLSLQQQIHF